MSHKTNKSLLLAVVMTIAMVCALAGGAFSQNTSTATANATATIVSPILLTKTVDMAFAEIAAGTSASTIILNATTGVRSVGSGNAKVGGGTSTAASFTVTGQDGYTYGITLPSTPVSLAGTPSGTMTVSNFTSDPTPTGTLTGGTSTLKVGATLNVGASQVAGSYTGTFSVTVAYP